MFRNTIALSLTLSLLNTSACAPPEHEVIIRGGTVRFTMDEDNILKNNALPRVSMCLVLFFTG